MNADQRKWRQHSDAVCCFPFLAGKSWGRTRRSWLLCSVGWRRSRRCCGSPEGAGRKAQGAATGYAGRRYTQPANRPIKKKNSQTANWPTTKKAACLQSRRISEHALESRPPSWIGEPRKPGMSATGRLRVWDWGELGKGGRELVFCTGLAWRAGVLVSTHWNSGRHLRLGNRESLGWVQKCDPMAAETIGWIYPLSTKNACFAG